MLALEAVVQHLHEDLERFTASTERVLQQANSNNQTLAERDQALGDEIQSLAARLRESETQRSGDWELAEASYLARLAEQRLIISGDTDSARELLFEADQILRDLGYPELRNARQALANARQALSMAHVPDTQRIFFELNALKTLSTGLVINQLDQLEPLQSDASHAGGDGFWSNLGVAIKNHLGPFFIVRKQDSAPNLQASVDEEFVLRNRLALQLEQAQMAVLNPDQTIYDAALKSAHELVLAHFVAGSQRDGFLSQIDSLAAEQLQAQIPDLSAMQRALLDAEHVLQSRVDGP